MVFVHVMTCRRFIQKNFSSAHFCVQTMWGVVRVDNYLRGLTQDTNSRCDSTATTQFFTNVRQKVSCYHFDCLLLYVSNLTILQQAIYRSSLSFPMGAKGGRAMVKLPLNTSLPDKKAHSPIKAKLSSCKYFMGQNHLVTLANPCETKKALLRWMREGGGGVLDCWTTLLRPHTPLPARTQCINEMIHINVEVITSRFILSKSGGRYRENEKHQLRSLFLCAFFVCNLFLFSRLLTAPPSCITLSGLD